MSENNMGAAAERLSDVDAILLEQSNYMDRVLVAWAIWTHVQSVRLGYPEAGNIWGLVTPKTRRFELDLTADQLTDVDHQVAQRPWRIRKMIFVEYWLEESQEVKARRFGLKRTAYGDRLDVIRQDLYRKLQPAIDDWRQLVL